MKLKIGIWSGDDRQCYLAEEFLDMGHEVWVWELGNGGKTCPLLSEFYKVNTAGGVRELAEQCDVLAGPVPLAKYLSAKDGFEQVLKDTLRAGQYFFAGGIPKTFLSVLEQKGVYVTDYLESENFLRENAKLTAQGCIGEIIGAWKKRICSVNVLVTGFGYCGREIAHAMRGIGANVTVCVRRMQSALEAYEEGFAICYYEQLGSTLSKTDIVINTVPARVFGESQLRRVKKGTLFVEIASAPGGFHKETAESFGIEVMLCPGLPGKYAPYGAAQAMSECIMNAVKSQERRDF